MKVIAQIGLEIGRECLERPPHWTGLPAGIEGLPLRRENPDAAVRREGRGRGNALRGQQRGHARAAPALIEIVGHQIEANPMARFKAEGTAQADIILIVGAVIHISVVLDAHGGDPHGAFVA
ncbi:hypothetical protein E4T56_gene14134, partial [Termitomyces sp. T112]